ncbi:MAG: lamin tail domain-containing protein [Anaerolineales bacterium]|nr:lamin tail domain-containing protein [Anaerolineales bacterium]
MHNSTPSRLLLLLIILFLAACAKSPDTAVPAAEAPQNTATAPATTNAEVAGATNVTLNTTPAAAHVASGILISEILVGVPGDNNVEFVELYNAGSTAVSLEGYTLWLNVQPDQKEPLFAWDAPAVVPPYGHYLLVRAGQDVGQAPDAVFTAALAASRGGLLLEDAGGAVVDRLGWGAAPPAAAAGAAATMPTDGGSLQRLPGGAAGSAQQTGDNAADFAANAAPDPQNSGSPMTPLPPNRLDVSLSAPAQLAPGETFALEITVTNPMDTAVANAAVAVPLPDYFAVLSTPPDAATADGVVAWSLPTLGAGETAVFTLELTSPFTYVDTRLAGYYAEAEGLVRSYGTPQLVVMAGGAIPIATARELIGSVVSIEGVATMYTGGFFAGSTGVKFYMEDDTGGIQVYVPGGAGQVAVNIGDRVRVTGQLELYRDSLEIIPVEIPADVEVLGQTAPPEPLPVSVTDVAGSDAILGQLAVVEGTATRIEEFNFSYEVDLTDNQGNTALVLIEKDTGVTAELLDLGQQYRVTGIAEFYSGYRQIKPRVQADLAEIFPPIVSLTLQAPINVQTGERITYTITIHNHTPTALTDATLTVPLPLGVAIMRTGGDAAIVDNEAVWQIAALPGEGGRFEAQLFGAVSAGNGAVEAAPARLSAAGLSAELASNPFVTFVGDGVPIWAIQGPDDRSPYVRHDVTTNGIVTGVFPDLHGFFLQETQSDADPATSAGIFVLFGDPNDTRVQLPVAPGDAVRLTGRVRELSGQTTLHVATADAITVLSQENALPPAVAIDPPTDTLAAAAYNETLEGMLVTLGETAVVAAPTTQYGEFALVYEKWGVETVPRGGETGILIRVDDGSQVVHDTQATLPLAVQLGDQITSLTGPLAFTFDQYKIEPIALPTVIATEQSLPSLPPTVPNQLRIVTFNVENFFDDSQPHPDSPPLPSRAEYERKLEKLAEAIVRLGTPAIIGLQEVENVDVLQDLAAVPTLAPFGYEAYLIEGPDSRGIDVAYLVRGEIVSVAGIGAYADDAGVVARPTLVMTATVQAPSGPLTLFLLNNHFTALSEGEAATEPRRTAQAAWNVSLMDQLLARNPDAQVVVMGDLNSFYATPPIETLQTAGLRHAYEALPETERPYTYIFEGATQTLDHILLSARLFAQVTAVEVLHINAGYPIPGADDYTARRVSDHDPLAVTLTLE